MSSTFNDHVWDVLVDIAENGRDARFNALRATPQRGANKECWIVMLPLKALDGVMIDPLQQGITATIQGGQIELLIDDYVIEDTQDELQRQARIAKK